MAFVRGSISTKSPYVLHVDSEKTMKALKVDNKFRLNGSVLERCNRIAKFGFPKKDTPERWLPRELPNGSLKTPYDGMAFTDTVLDDISYEMAHPFEPFIVVKI